MEASQSSLALTPKRHPTGSSAAPQVILLGNGATGKTSLAQRFANDQFAQSYKQTIGLDFFMKRITLPGDVEVALQVSLWPGG